MIVGVINIQLINEILTILLTKELRQVHATNHLKVINNLAHMLDAQILKRSKLFEHRGGPVHVRPQGPEVSRPFNEIT